MQPSFAHGWSVRAIVIAVLAFGLMQTLVLVLSAVFLLLAGHSSQTFALNAAVVLMLLAGLAPYFLSGLVAGRLASRRPTAHGAWVGALGLAVNAAMVAAIGSPMSPAEPLPEPSTGWAILGSIANATVAIGLAAVGGWRGGKRRRAAAS